MEILKVEVEEDALTTREEAAEGLMGEEIHQKSCIIGVLTIPWRRASRGGARGRIRPRAKDLLAPRL